MSTFEIIAGHGNARQGGRIGLWSRNRRARRVAFIPAPILRLEDRQLLSQTFTVVDPVNDGSTGSLDWAIQQVNEDTTDSSSSPDVIDFNIPARARS